MGAYLSVDSGTMKVPRAGMPGVRSNGSSTANERSPCHPVNVDHSRRYDFGAMRPSASNLPSSQPRARAPLPHSTSPPRSLQATIRRPTIAVPITALLHSTFNIRPSTFDLRPHQEKKVAKRTQKTILAIPSVRFSVKNEPKTNPPRHPTKPKKRAAKPTRHRPHPAPVGRRGRRPSQCGGVEEPLSRRAGITALSRSSPTRRGTTNRCLRSFGLIAQARACDSGRGATARL